MKFQKPMTLLFKQNNGKSQICLERPYYRNGWLCGLRLRSACQRNRLPCQTDDIGTIWGCQCGHFLSWWTIWPFIFLKSRTSTEVVLLRKSCSPQVVIASFNDQEYRNWDRTKSWWSENPIISEFCKSIHALMFIYALNMRRSDPSWK